MDGKQECKSLCLGIIQNNPFKELSTDGDELSCLITMKS